MSKKLCEPLRIRNVERNYIDKKATDSKQMTRKNIGPSTATLMEKHLSVFPWHSGTIYSH